MLFNGPQLIKSIRSSGWSTKTPLMSADSNGQRHPCPALIFRTNGLMLPCFRGRCPLRVCYPKSIELVGSLKCGNILYMSIGHLLCSYPLCFYPLYLSVAAKTILHFMIGLVYDGNIF